MKKILCFGELLLRLSPRLGGEWIRQSGMNCFVGGAELNVASALALWQLPVQYITALPDNYLSKEIIEALTEKNIDCGQFIQSGSRIGLYYLPQGADLKHAAVIYDRAGSSFSELRPGSIDWDHILEGIEWFHFSAISPALGKSVAAVCEEAVMAAAKKNITVSLDLNYRARLWQYGVEPVKIMRPLAAHCNVLMGNIWSANSLLGIPLDKDIHNQKTKEAYLDHAGRSAASLRKHFPSCKSIASTFRFDEGEGIKYYACLDDEGKQSVSREYRLPGVVDRVGSGDCFMAGLIYGLSKRDPLQQVVEFAAAAAAGKFSVKGDVTNQTVTDILSLAQSIR
jgi:2-dehydro-3-deoxygluconokinase